MINLDLEKNNKDLFPELTQEDLEAICGGTIDNEQEGHILRTMKAFKCAGATKEYTIEKLMIASSLPGSTISGVTMDELRDYINAHWDMA